MNKRLMVALVLLGASLSVWGQTFGDGTHLVGSDIQAGTYRAPGGEWCTWERLSGLGGDFSDLIAGDVPTGRAVVEIKQTDKAFKVSGCGTWELISSSGQSEQAPTDTAVEVLDIASRSLAYGVIVAIRPDNAMMDEIERLALWYASKQWPETPGGLKATMEAVELVQEAIMALTQAMRERSL